MLSSYFKTAYFISAVTGSVLLNLVFSQTPLLTSHISAQWSSTPSGQLQGPLTTSSRDHTKSRTWLAVDTSCKAHQPHHVHFQAVPLSPHKLAEAHTKWQHFSVLAIQFKLSIAESSPAFITVYWNLLSMLNAQLKDAILLCRSLCVTIINRTWLDVLGSTRYRMLCSLRQ